MLVNQRQQPIRVTESLPAVEITEPVADTYVVKFPRVLAGWVEFAVDGPAGTTVRAQYGEKLLANGLPDFSNNGGFGSGFQTDRFILAGTGGDRALAGAVLLQGLPVHPGHRLARRRAAAAERLHGQGGAHRRRRRPARSRARAS